MKEHIEREAALTEFQKVCDICMALVKIPMCGECSVADTVRKVKRIPAADVQPVVYCKDCTVPHNKWTGCPKLCGLVTEPDFFCAFGEPKGETDALR